MGPRWSMKRRSVREAVVMTLRDRFASNDARNVRVAVIR
jgi:hypothetical protein